MIPLATGTTPKCTSAAPVSDARALLLLQTVFSVRPAHFHSGQPSGSDGDRSLCTDLHRHPERKVISLSGFVILVGSNVLTETNLDITDFKGFIKGATSQVAQTNMSEHPIYFLELLINEDLYTQLLKKVNSTNHE